MLLPFHHLSDLTQPGKTHICPVTITIIMKALTRARVGYFRLMFSRVLSC